MRNMCFSAKEKNKVTTKFIKLCNERHTGRISKLKFGCTEKHVNRYTKLYQYETLESRCSMATLERLWRPKQKPSLCFECEFLKWPFNFDWRIYKVVAITIRNQKWKFYRILSKSGGFKSLNDLQNYLCDVTESEIEWKPIPFH